MEMNRHIGERGWYKNGVWIVKKYPISRYCWVSEIEKWMIGCKFQGDIFRSPKIDEDDNYDGIITFEDGRNNESFSGNFNTTHGSPGRIQICHEPYSFAKRIFEFVECGEKCEYIHGNTHIDIMPYLESGEIKSCDVIECRDAIRRILSTGVKHKDSLCDVNVECDIVFML